jgi:hypothetical protein
MEKTKYFYELIHDRCHAKKPAVSRRIKLPQGVAGH